MSLSIKIKIIKKLSDEIDFGKHKGKLVSDVLDDDPKYLEWMINHTTRTDFSPRVKKKIRDACDEIEAEYYDIVYMGEEWDWKD